MRVETKERPILFSGEMVRAILDGRKTQTRRVCKEQPAPWGAHCLEIGGGESYWLPEQFEDGSWSLYNHVVGWDGDFGRCPYGRVGDRLYVRERALYWVYGDGSVGGGIPVVYQDDAAWDKTMSDMRKGAPPGHEGGWWKLRPSIHMPRWASRITLEITDIRVQRVQEISPNDCRSEGVRSILRSEQSYIDGFSRLWDSINQKRGFGWDTNPWVWALTFKRLEAGR